MILAPDVPIVLGEAIIVKQSDQLFIVDCLASPFISYDRFSSILQEYLALGKQNSLEIGSRARVSVWTDFQTITIIDINDDVPEWTERFLETVKRHSFKVK